MYICGYTKNRPEPSETVRPEPSGHRLEPSGPRRLSRPDTGKTDVDAGGFDVICLSGKFK